MARIGQASMVSVEPGAVNAGRVESTPPLERARPQAWRRDLMREWLAVGAIRRRKTSRGPHVAEYGYNAAGAIQIERKESLKARGLASPDTADALACTPQFTAVG